MQIFKHLEAELIDKRGGAGIEDFPKFATELLHQFKYDWSIEKLTEEIEKWMLKTEPLPKQISIHNSFGQPSVTLFNDGHYVIDLYFWVDFDTSIHSHGFRGAFRVLHGQSLHETFKVKTTKSISEDVRLVDMSEVERELLIVGDVREISPGLELTHRVVHLENPTVTLCIRTVNETDLKQWTYLKTGLAIKKSIVTEDILKKILFFQFYYGRDRILADRFLNGLLDQLNLSSQIHVYEEVASGAAGLYEEVAEDIAHAFVLRHQSSEWWALYEKAHLARMDEISFEHCQDPVERLVGHFINNEVPFEKVRKILGTTTEARARSIVDSFLLDASPAQAELARRFL